MSEQFLYNLFQTSLYLFSSLLQADAAILGFGTVFIIFKLQALDSTKQGIIQTYYTKGSIHIGIINSLLLSDDPKEIASILFAKRGDAYDYRNYLYVLLIPAKSKYIGHSIKWPVIVIGIHTIFCGLLLSVNQFFYKCLLIEYISLGFTLIWFGYGIYLAASLAISLLTKPDQYRLDELRPDVYKHMSDIESKQKGITK